MSLTATIVHAINGRVRLRVPAVTREEGLGELVEAYLVEQPGILDVRCNQGCASLTVWHDPLRWDPQGLCAHVQQLTPEEVAAYGVNNQAQRRKQESSDGGGSGFELTLSSAGVALSLLAEPVTPVVLPFLLVGSAWSMFSRAYEAFAVKDKLNVDVLDASATTLLTAQGQFPMAMFMVWLVNLGDYIRDTTVMKAQHAVEEVLAYRGCKAWVERDGQKIEVPVESIECGETVIVYPGERIPVDGIVLSGQAVVDQQALTGESAPVMKQAGESVFAATVVQDGKLYVRAEQVGEGTQAAKIVRLVEDAPAHETRAQNYAEQWADSLVPYSFLGAGANTVLGGGIQGAASILIIDYGTGIRIAAPTTVLASMTKAVRQGILIKGGRYLEQLADIDVVVFDKTGTLTRGAPEVGEVIPRHGHSWQEVLSLAAASEQRLTHPVAQAIVRAAQAKGLSIPERDGSDYTIGLGVESAVNGYRVMVGSERFMAHKAVPIPPDVEQRLAGFHTQALSPLCVAVDGSVIGLLTYTDPLRPEAADVVARLREMGVLEIVMLTGDNPSVARRVADHLGITHYTAEMMPAEKVEVVKQWQDKGYRVAVVGDGINDSPALAHADVGIAIDGGADIAQETAQVVLLNSDLWKVPMAIDISRETMRLIRQNWHIISVPNTIALALAFGGFLGPGATTLLSNGSAVLATGNALRPLLA